MAEPPERSAQAKLASARARLILDKPFIGVLLLHLPFEPAPWCESIATDARRIYYSPDYILALRPSQVQFVLAHQALHCALGHFARRGHRIRRRWDAACDYAVNLLLADESLEPVAGARCDEAFRNLSAEEIYPLLDAREIHRGFDTHLFAHGAAGVASQREPGDGAETQGGDAGSHPASPDALDSDAAPQAPRNRGRSAVAADAPEIVTPEELARRWQMRFALAAQQARHAGRLSAAWQRLLSVSLQPPLPWRALLARFLASRAQEDYSFQRPQRRESAFILPRLASESIDVHAVLDTSGSIGDAELAAFTAEIDALKGQIRARVTVHACDCALAPQGPWTFEPWQPIVLPQHLAGGGGTDFRPVFEWLHANARRPDALLYFTDACGPFPEQAPAFPVVWLVKGNAPVPWGERVQFTQ